MMEGHHYTVSYWTVLKAGPSRENALLGRARRGMLTMVDLASHKTSNG